MYRGPIKERDKPASFDHLVGQLSDPDPNSDEHHGRLWSLMLRYDRACQLADQRLTIICERFQYRQEDRQKVELISKEYEGLIKFFVKTHPNTRLVLQNAAQAVGATSFWGDSKAGNRRLATAGLFKHNMVHGMDATRHFAYFVTFALRDHRYLTNLPKENVSA
jgi:hypothetical protein